MIKVNLFLVLALFLPFQVCMADKPLDLTKRSYAKFRNEKAVILLHINWGRSWGCNGNENAQIQELHFKNTNLEGSSLELKTNSKLFVNDSFVPYSLIVDPGIYAISKIDVKIARSSKKIEHLKIDEANLFEEGNPKAVHLV